MKFSDWPSISIVGLNLCFQMTWVSLNRNNLVWSNNILFLDKPQGILNLQSLILIAHKITKMSPEIDVKVGYADIFYVKLDNICNHSNIWSASYNIRLSRFPDSLGTIWQRDRSKL